MRFVAMLCLLHVALPAQQPGAAAAAGLERPVRSVSLDASAGDTLWARGTDWKAGFGPSGLQFVPFLGSTAPRNWPVAVELQRVTAGGEAIALGTPHVEAHGSEQVAIARGGVVELYRLAASGVEQQFVFAARPGRGDLTVELALHTELAVSLRDDGSLCCANELGGVAIGRATAVDARGAQAPCTTRLVGSTLSWTVPAAFVATAALPLTIDPVFQTFGLIAATATQGTPDVAYVDAIDGCYAFVLEEVFSATDTDIRVVARSASGAASSYYYADLSTADWRGPKVAGNRSDSQFLCVAHERSNALVPVGRVVARLMDYTVVGGQPVLAIGAVMQLSTGSLLGIRLPDVGGDGNEFALQPANYCVTWADSGLLYYVFVDANGALSAAGGSVVPFVSVFPAARPTISKSCGAETFGSHEWTIVYEMTISASNRDLWGTRIRVDGSIPDAHFPIATGPEDDTVPHVSSPADTVAGEPWMVVWQRNLPASPTTIGHADVHGAVFSASTPLTGDVNLTPLLARPIARNQLAPCVDSDGVRFAVGFSEDISTFSTDQVPWLATVHLTPASTLDVTSFPESLSSYVGVDDRLQIAAQHSGGARNTAYAVAWEAHAAGAQPGSARAGLYFGHTNLPEASYFQQALPGCGALTLVAEGRPALGGTFSMSLLNAQGFPLLILGASTTPLSLCPACDLGVDLATAVILAQTVWSLSVPPDVALIGANFGAQGADLFATGGCSPALLGFGFTLSNEIVVTVL